MSQQPLKSIGSQQELLKVLVEIVVQSTEDVLAAQCELKVSERSVKFDAPAELSEPVSISASVNMISEELTGTLLFAFPQKTFLSITSKVLGEEFENISDENADFAGEILNMCFGASKTKLSQVKSVVLQPSIPSVVRGVDLKPAVSTNHTRVGLMFGTEFGKFFAVLSFKK
jgi:CheY-specific phosphatase CheX